MNARDDGQGTFQRNLRRYRKVQVDATVKDGRAFVAMTGCLGVRSVEVAATGNAHAELLAILAAMRECLHQTPKGRRPKPLLIVTDSEVVGRARNVEGPAAAPWHEIKRYLARYRQWKVEKVDRTAVAQAHREATRARHRAATDLEPER